GFGFDGAGRIDADNRAFAVPFFHWHQEHCLLYLHKQLTNRRRFPRHWHCLNYLRKQTLCHPDSTPEPGDLARCDFELDCVGQTDV
ncbi:hypothetical protein EDB85DRAFT_1827852, partial [Lactarius pseudohatsudake]